MSYEMKYHPHLCKGLTLKTRKRNAHNKIKWIILVCLLLVGINLRNMEFWRDFLIPGDTERTISAVETFAGNIKGGDSFETAFRNFYMEILEVG